MLAAWIVGSALDGLLLVHMAATGQRLGIVGSWGPSSDLFYDETLGFMVIIMEHQTEIQMEHVMEAGVYRGVTLGIF